jgi:prepilin-type N-terminal cleavage/methylation domain-containing protein
MQNGRGFTLIEMAVVLVIGGIILAAMVSTMNSFAVSSRDKATRTKEDAIKSALSTFLVRNTRLPCPAVSILAAPLL